MGWDVKSSIDGVIGVMPSKEQLQWLTERLPPSEMMVLWLVVFLVAMLALKFFTRTSVGRQFRGNMAETAGSNWQLAILGTAAFVLSLAGGWTTWDGMRNFTGEPLLSLMFTFGIHGVMLIVAWLIGESFATGMSTVRQSSMARVTVPLIVIVALALVLLVTALGVYHWRYQVATDSWMQAFAVGGAGLLGLALIMLFSKSDVIAPYGQALRIIAKNSMLWVMFLACMATSVFFSFDSRFNVVFPEAERKRVADLRAQNQVMGIVADIGSTITTQRLEQAEKLFESDGWRAYDTQLVTLARIAQGAQTEIERYFVQQMEERRRGIAQQQERIATAQSGQAGLAGKKLSLTEELARARAERPGLAAEYAQHKSELDAKQKTIDEKRVEALAEDRGVEGTLKQGKGPVYRERMAELARLQDEYKIKEERTKDAQKRLSAVESRISQMERELSGIDSEIAKLKGEAQTAELRIKAVQEVSTATEGPTVDPARALLAFETARAEFRQDPTVDKLAQLQQLCGHVLGAMSSTPATKDKVRSIDCDPKQASEAAAAVFALNAGSRTFESNCAGGDKLARYAGADALFGFAKTCLADSGLPSKETDALRTKISFTEMTRDDRAHHFVVSWNAFQDGNRLAYLALAIAIGIDSLIFMTGLFGANALRSPLSDVPSRKARTGHQLEAIIQNALLPDIFENARATLHAMRPITPEDGHVAEIWMGRDSFDNHIAAVLNAGAAIGAVRRDEAWPDRYLVRAELFEFLSIVAKKAFDTDREKVRLADLEKSIAVALLPDIARNAQIVQDALMPMTEEEGFSAEMHLASDLSEATRVLRKVLNAGSAFGAVQRVGADAQNFFVHRDFVRALSTIQARVMLQAPRLPALETRGGRQVRDAGELRSNPPEGSPPGSERARQTPAVAAEPRPTLPAPAKRKWASWFEKLKKPSPLADSAKRGMPKDVADGPAPGKPLRLSDHARGQTPPREQTAADANAELRNQFRSKLLAIMHVKPSEYTQIKAPEFQTAIAAAADALGKFTRSNRFPSEFIRDRQQKLRADLDGAYSSLWGQQVDRDRQQILEQVHDELAGVLPQLMLTADGPYERALDHVIQGVEDEAGTAGLKTEEKTFLAGLQRQRKLLRAVDRSRPAGWHHIAEILEASEDAPVALFSSAKARRGQ